MRLEGTFDVVMSCMMVLCLFVTILVFGVVIKHIGLMHQKLHLTNVENSKLLDGMHEGILIRRKADDEGTHETVMYINHSAKKTIDNYVYSRSSSEPEKDKTEP